MHRPSSRSLWPERLVVAYLALGVFAPAIRAAPPVTRAPAAAIASGKPFWVDSQPDPKDALLDALVDIGTLRQSGDAIVAKMRWHAPPRDSGHYELDTEHVICASDRMLSYPVDLQEFDSSGHLVKHKVYDPIAQRAKETAWQAKFKSALSPYGTDQRSLACWAAARKCEGKAFNWPPPPDSTPLEHSARAKLMAAKYSRMFVPSCRLGANSK